MHTSAPQHNTRQETEKKNPAEKRERERGRDESSSPQDRVTAWPSGGMAGGGKETECALISRRWLLDDNKGAAYYVLPGSLPLHWGITYTQWGRMKGVCPFHGQCSGYLITHSVLPCNMDLPFSHGCRKCIQMSHSLWETKTSWRHNIGRVSSFSYKTLQLQSTGVALSWVDCSCYLLELEALYNRPQERRQVWLWPYTHHGARLENVSCCQKWR